MPKNPVCRHLADTVITTEQRAQRRAHPDATLTEIEQAWTPGLRAARAALLADVAADTGDDDDDPRCPGCGGRLVPRGRRTRTLRTHGDVPVPLTRAYLSCPAYGVGLSPLDERLGLLADRLLTPWVIESAVRLGASLPFAKAADLLAHFTGVRADAETRGATRRDRALSSTRPSLSVHPVGQIKTSFDSGAMLAIIPAGEFERRRQGRVLLFPSKCLGVADRP